MVRNEDIPACTQVKEASAEAKPDAHVHRQPSHQEDLHVASDTLPAQKTNAWHNDTVEDEGDVETMLNSLRIVLQNKLQKGKYTAHVNFS